jgi:hypothetical protein
MSTWELSLCGHHAERHADVSYVHAPVLWVADLAPGGMASAHNPRVCMPPLFRQARKSRGEGH